MNTDRNLDAAKAAFEAIAAKYEIEISPPHESSLGERPYKYAHSNHLFEIFKEGYRADRAQPVAAIPEAMGKQMNTQSAREYLIGFMEQHFTDKTFHRYIRGEATRNVLAGDFAWQLAHALRRIDSLPAIPEAGQSVPKLTDEWIGAKYKECLEQWRRMPHISPTMDLIFARAIESAVIASMSADAEKGGA